MAGRKQKLAEVARRNRVELVEAGVTRRDLFKLGLVTASGYLVARLGLSTRAAGAESPASPATTPWIEELPIPPVAKPLDVGAMEAMGAAGPMNPAPTREPNVGAGEMARSGPHQHWSLYRPQGTDHYLVESRPTPVSWHRELPMDACWCYDGVFPGTRIHARHGRPVLLRMRNALPSLGEHVGYGRPTTSAHLLGGHTASESDGNPLDVTEPGGWRDHLYLNHAAGFTDPRFAPGGDPRELSSTLCYHDRSIGFTAQNVYRGSVGLYFQFNDFDTGDENDPAPTAWRLPSGAFDVPLVLHDRVFDPEGKGYFDLFRMDGILGDKFTVNGKIQPFLRVAGRKYRFRVLNVGVSRVYDLALSSGQAVTQITRDGNLLPRPLSTRAVRLPVGGRADVIVDFSRSPSGAELYLVNALAQVDGRGPRGETLPVERGTRLLKFIVDGSLDTHGDPSRIPERLLDLPPIDRAEVVTERTFVFGRANGGWSVNGKPLDPNEIWANPRQGTAEIWNLVNDSSDWAHPVHVPLEAHQVVTRNGIAPPGDGAREDMAWLAPGDAVKTFRRFRDFLGRYPTHCGDACHEDQAMMFMWKVVA